MALQPSKPSSLKLFTQNFSKTLDASKIISQSVIDKNLFETCACSSIGVYSRTPPPCQWSPTCCNMLLALFFWWPLLSCLARAFLCWGSLAYTPLRGRFFPTAHTIEKAVWLSLVPRPLFLSFCVGAEKKRYGGSPIEFLCSQIYNFWGSLITADEQQRPANEARMEKQRTITSTLKFKWHGKPFFIIASLAGRINWHIWPNSLAEFPWPYVSRGVSDKYLY